MKKKIIIGTSVIIGILLFVLTGIFVFITITVNNKASSIGIIGGADGPTAIFVAEKIGDKTMYKNITMEEAKVIFETPGDYIILDVRRPDEFAEGHIPGAINFANEDIDGSDIGVLPDKDQIIYVYCRSGNRSKQASEKLINMGYTNIIEFGGILDWSGDIEK